MTFFALPTGPARVLLVDDHALFRAGLRELLASDRRFQVAGEAATVREAAAVFATTPADLAVVDVSLPDGHGGGLVRELRRHQPRCRTLALSMIDDAYRIAELLGAGADGYALKSQPPEQVVDALAAVLRGQTYLAPSLPADTIEALRRGEVTSPIAVLSPREREVFELLVRGLTNERVAETLFISVRTVDTHRQNLMAKLGTKSVVELLRLAARHGLLGLEHG